MFPFKEKNKVPQEPQYTFPLSEQRYELADTTENGEFIRFVPDINNKFSDIASVRTENKQV